MKIISPKTSASFLISSAPEWPTIVFETDGTGTHTWNWSVSWRTFKKTGTTATSGNKWEAKSIVQDLGGTFSVQASSSKGIAIIRVAINGTNPQEINVKQDANANLEQRSC